MPYDDGYSHQLWHSDVMGTLDSLFVFGANDVYLFIVLIAGAFILRQPVQQRKRTLLLGVISFPIAYGVLKLIGHFYYDARPFVVGHFLPLVPHEANNGFPSDHTFIAAAISALLWPFTRPGSLICWGLTVFVAVSRVYVGVHHPIDVIGSIIGSILVTGLVWRYRRVNGA